jgi:hypothetical protein
MDLGLHTPYKTSKVVTLKKFKFNKITGRIGKQQIRKVPVTRGNPLSIFMKTTMVKDVRKYPLSIASSGTTFTTTTEWNLNNLFR